MGRQSWVSAGRRYLSARLLSAQVGQRMTLELESDWETPTPGCGYVNTVDKGLRGEFGVKAVDKGLTDVVCKWTSEKARSAN